MSPLHLLVQGHLERPLKPRQVEGLLLELPQHIGMTIISGPHVFEHSGIVVIAESHISVHWLGLACWVDVFSCREFDPERATHFIQARLKFRSMADTRVVARGAADVPSHA